jgi:hypothetical protein
MKRIIVPVGCLLIAGMLAPIGWAQDPERATPEAKTRKQDWTGIPVKVQVVFSEYDGDKKVKSLPYSISLNAMRTPDTFNPWTKLRIGNRVPNGQMQYLEVGTNIDSRVIRNDDGRYALQLNVERSWFNSSIGVPQKSTSETSETTPSQFKDPIIQQFKSELNITVREGEIVESTLATDPLSGKVTKIQVSVSAVK